MSNNLRVRAVGGWTFNSAVLPQEFERIDSQLAGSISGTGGTYAPTSLLTIGGTGVTITSPFNAPAADSITVTNLLTVTNTGLFNLVGNQTVQSGATVQFVGGSFLTLSSGAAFTANGGSTIAVNGTATLGGSVTLNSGGSIVTNVGSAITINGAFTGNSVAAFTKGVAITQSSVDTTALGATGNGSGAGATFTGGVTGPGLVSAPGTASTAAAPQCGGRFAGFIEITAADPVNGFGPPAGRHVIYGLSVAKAYGTARVGGGATPTVFDELNVDSILDVSPGVYEVVFVTPMPTTIYSVTLSTNTAGRGVVFGTKTVNGFQFTVYDTTTGAVEPLATIVDFHMFGRR